MDHLDQGCWLGCVVVPMLLQMLLQTLQQVILPGDGLATARRRASIDSTNSW